MDDTQSTEIANLIAETLGIPRDQITEQFTYGDAPEWDSMGHMEVMMVLEQYFGIEINNDTIAGLTSVPIIRQHIVEMGLLNRTVRTENGYAG